MLVTPQDTGKQKTMGQADWRLARRNGGSRSSAREEEGEEEEAAAEEGEGEGEGERSVISGFAACNS
jgi:hypothetical protein